MPTVTYPFDSTGQAVSNLVSGELHTLTEVNARPYRVLIPVFAPFYLHNLLVEHIAQDGAVTPMTEDVDYYPVLQYMAASRSLGQPVYGGFSFINDLPNGTIRLRYQTLGGDWIADPDYVYQQLLEAVFNRRSTWWDMLTNVQQIFPPLPHNEHTDDLEGHEALIDKLETIRQALLQTDPSLAAMLQAHMAAHGAAAHPLQASDVGLDQVANYPMATDQEVLARQPLNKYVTLRQILLLLS